MKRYKKLIEMARAMKPLYQSMRAFHVAGIYRKKRLISLGFNTTKTHPKAIGHYPNYQHTKASHAEFLAVIRARLEDFSGHDLIVVRVDNNNSINNSKMCVHCTAFLKNLNFDNIYYSDAAGNLQQFIF